MSLSSVIYMDYAASTPLDPRVAAVMRPLWEDMAGNASSLQNLHGQTLRKEVERAQEKVAHSIGALPEEIFFTSGATEANNLALFGISEFLKKEEKTHIISTPAEHKSVLMPLAQMANQGFNVSFSKALPCGMADGPFVLEEITEQTGLISVQAVNNETGVINPLNEVRDGIIDTDIMLHIDATQALGKIPLNVKDIGAHMATFSGHKIYGPQGSGVLYIDKDIQSRIKPLLYGGRQQGSIRPGTFPVALIAGIGEACRIAAEEQVAEKDQLESFYTLFRSLLDNFGIDYTINGHDYGDDSRNWRVPGIMNIRFPGIQNEWLLEAINNVSFSTGSACGVSGNKPSHVLEAMGLSAQESAESVRISFGRFTTEDEIRQTAQSFIQAISAINDMTNAA